MFCHFQERITSNTWVGAFLHEPNVQILRLNLQSLGEWGVGDPFSCGKFKFKDF